MVAAIIAILLVGAALIIFKDDIAKFFGESITKPITEGFGLLGTQLTSGVEEIGKSADATFIDPIRKAGEAAGRAEAERRSQEIIERTERDLVLAAQQSGFASIEEFNKASDSGAVVIGGTRTVVDFGLIGDVLPSDPSPEFLASPEKFLTETQLVEFNKVFNQTTTTRGTSRFGGQR